MSISQLGSRQPHLCDILTWEVWGSTTSASRLHLKVLKVLQVPSAGSSFLPMCPNEATSEGFRVLTSYTVHLKLYQVQTLQQESSGPPGLHLQFLVPAFPAHL